jgi:ribonuclease J
VKLTIHRGAKEIGGSCIELETARTRILLDFGMPLVNEKHEPFDSGAIRGKTVAELKAAKVLPDIPGLYKGGPRSIDAILISHSHQDHYGLLGYADPGIPLYMSQGVKALIEVSNIFIHDRPARINAEVVKPWKPFKIGDFTITAYLVDHSGPDAMAFLVEADGKRVYYSGDFRGHGRKSVLFDRALKAPPGDIDYLLLEGTMLGRDNEPYRNESDIEAKIVEILKASKTVTFLSSSSQNIDRIVSAYRACLKTGKTFVIDLYTAFILSKLTKISKKLPQYNSDNVRVKFWHAHAKALEKAGYRDLLFVYNKRKIELIEMAKDKARYLMLARDNSVFGRMLKELSDVTGAKLIYSMYEKYLTDEFAERCKTKGIEIEHVHTSGHATPDELKSFASALGPKTIIPIHTFQAEMYKDLFANVRIIPDGKTLDL